MTKKGWQSKRQTNPLEPTYIIRDSALGDFGRKPDVEGKVNEGYGGIEGAKPAGLPKAREGVRNLNT
mgnify:CR=1 FL=1